MIQEFIFLKLIFFLLLFKGGQHAEHGNEDDLVYPGNNDVKFLKMDTSMLSNPQEVKRVDSGASSSSLANVMKSHTMKSNTNEDLSYTSETNSNYNDNSKLKHPGMKDTENVKAYAEW